MKQAIAQEVFAPGTSRSRRSRSTLLLQMARDLERQQAIGERLRALRDSRPDLTQQKIADYVGITVRGYQFWEAGDTGIDHDNILRLAELFGVTPTYLYEGENPTTVSPDILVRIESKLDELLAILRPQSPAEVLELEADRLDAQRKRTAAKSQRTRRSASGS